MCQYLLSPFVVRAQWSSWLSLTAVPLFGQWDAPAALDEGLVDDATFCGLGLSPPL